MIAGANQREYVIKRPQATESNWRYRPVPDGQGAPRRPLRMMEAAVRVAPNAKHQEAWDRLLAGLCFASAITADPWRNVAHGKTKRSITLTTRRPAAMNAPRLRRP